jgi:hypothetical protein
MPVELRSFAQERPEYATELARVSALAQQLLAHLMSPDAHLVLCGARREPLRATRRVRRIGAAGLELVLA